MEHIEGIREFLGIQLRKALGPLTRGLAKLKITPNQITVVGTLLNLVAAVLVIVDQLIAAGIVFIIAGCFDMLDGALARYSGRVTPFGAFLDSTLDRVAEGRSSQPIAVIGFVNVLRAHPPAAPRKR